MKSFRVSMSTFSNGLPKFATDLRASMTSDWYCVSTFELVIT